MLISKHQAEDDGPDLLPARETVMATAVFSAGRTLSLALFELRLFLHPLDPASGVREGRESKLRR